LGWTPRVKELGLQNYLHEIGCNDFFVSLCLSGEDFTWTPVSDQADGFRFDRGFQIYGKQFYLERERGTQSKKDWREKIEQYINLKGKYFVVFTFEYYKQNPFQPELTKEAIESKERELVEEFLDLAGTYGRQHQFTATPQSFLVDFPLETILASPTGEAFSFRTIDRF
jgi:hypothetical protein